MFGMAPDLFFDRSRGLSQRSADQREINLLDRARFELSGQSAMRRVIFGHRQTAARLLV